VVSICQLLGGPLIGDLIDKRGVRWALILCQLGSAMAYLTLGASSSLALLFVSRIFTCLMQVMQSAQAAVPLLVSDATQRSAAIGRLSLAYGIGMILGAALGGFVSLDASAALSAALSVGSVLVTVAALHGNGGGGSSSSKAKEAGEEDKEAESSGGGSTLRDILSVATVPRVRALVLFLCCATLGIATWRSMWSLIAKQAFELSSRDIGLLMSYMALSATLFNSFLMGFVRRVAPSDAFIVKSCTLVLALCLAALAYVLRLLQQQQQQGGSSSTLSSSSSSWVVAYKVPILCIVAIPQAVSASLLYTMINAAVMAAVDVHQVGKAVSLSHATRSIVRVAAPFVGGAVMAQFGGAAASVAVFGAATSALACLLFDVLRIRLPDKKDEEEKVKEI
jgi:MFS family permease